MILLAIFVWIMCGVISAMIGSHKGMGGFGFFLGFVFGPFGLLMILTMEGDQLECPFCKKAIHKEATVCPYCRSEQPQKTEAQKATI